MNKNNPWRNYEKVGALAELLKVPEDEILFYDDGSMTIGHEDRVEYYATKGTRKYGEKLGRSKGFNIYKQ